MKKSHSKLLALTCALGILSSVSAYALPDFTTTSRAVSSAGSVSDNGIPNSDSWAVGSSSIALTGNYTDSQGGSAAIRSATASGNASQNTTINGGHIFGNGSSLNVAAETNPPVNPFANTSNFSTFETFFDLTSAHAFTLTGILSSFETASGSAVANGDAQFLLRDNLLNPILAFNTAVSPVNLASAGLLGAGSYSVFVQAATSVTSGPTAGLGLSSAAFNFDLALSPALVAVPEPSTLLLLGTGLVGLVGIGIRRRGKQV